MPETSLIFCFLFKQNPGSAAIGVILIKQIIIITLIFINIFRVQS